MSEHRYFLISRYPGAVWRYPDGSSQGTYLRPDAISEPAVKSLEEILADPAFDEVGWEDVPDWAHPDPEAYRVGEDLIAHPPHYTAFGAEVIDITEWLPFNLGNVVKYVARADLKGTPEEDLKKALWYLRRELAKRGVSE